MRIGPPKMTKSGDRIRWAVVVDGKSELPEQLWFEVSDSHEGLITERADPAVIGLLIPAMLHGESIEIDGQVTDELLHSLTHGYQQILATVLSRVREISIDAHSVLRPAPPAAGVATGFSAGVDSFAVLAEHHYSPVPPGLRLTHLTLFNVGATGSGNAGRRDFERLHELLSPTTEQIGLPLVAVDSNLDDFYPSNFFRQSHGPRNLAAAALLMGGIGRYLAAGSYAFRDLGVFASPTTGHADSIATPLLVNSQFHPSSHGDRLTRAQKTVLIAGIPAARQSLNVCTWLPAHGRNCSTCYKCLRTQLTLEIAGQLDAYSERFDLDAYRAVRGKFIDRVITINEPYHIEIREFAADLGYSLPSGWSAVVRRAGRGIRHRIDLMVRRLRAVASTRTLPE
ncbi:hypothetical protein [Agromyces sp. Marseille-P2726]|uniref:hypothetical protein n=1 Tax=Agromyces sp. Marseille-P2726 TaxID=2709132 RepID=UPI0015709CFF|nr:hypothetical protein [Agromyces sp. Marseille-P2726]